LYLFLRVKFLNENKNNTDIFCLQELFKSDRSVINPNGGRSNILEDLKKELSDFNFLFSPSYHGRDFEHIVDYPLTTGLCIFWKKSIKPLNSGTIFTHLTENEFKSFPGTDEPDRPVNFQYLFLQNYIIINIHGYWNPAPKSDVPERIEQSEKLIDFVKNQELPAILVGDFNLRMDTKSVAMFEENGFRNLVKESDAITTRTKYYDIKWRKIDKFADYIFVSKKLEVFDFKVMKDVVSDHSPLFIEFEI